jgi:hypothetical protein
LINLSGCKNEKTILVYKVLYVKFRLNSVKGGKLPVNDEKAQRCKGVTVQWHNGRKIMLFLAFIPFCP